MAAHRPRPGGADRARPVPRSRSPPTREIAAEQAAAIARVVTAAGTCSARRSSGSSRLRASAGAAHAVGVGNGLDALRLTLQALGIGPGDEVIVPSHTYIATWLGITATGAGRSRSSPRRTCSPSTRTPSRPRSGRARRRSCPSTSTASPPRWPALEALAARHGAGARRRRRPGPRRPARRPSGRRLRHAATWSFYPSKNLGALGDGGAVTTDDAGSRARLRAAPQLRLRAEVRQHRAGRNSRLDELQAAILSVRLGHLEEWNARRAALAARYADGLAGTALALPADARRRRPCWHVYVVRTTERDALAEHLARGRRHADPLPDRAAPAAGVRGRSAGPPAPARGRAPAAEVLSLPIGPHLAAAAADRVIDFCSAAHTQAA